MGESNKISWQPLGKASYFRSRLSNNVKEKSTVRAPSWFSMTSALRSVKREEDGSVSIGWPPNEGLNL